MQVILVLWEVNSEGQSWCLKFQDTAALLPKISVPCQVAPASQLILERNTVLQCLPSGKVFSPVCLIK
jgi:hypothetical protein